MSNIEITTQNFSKFSKRFKNLLNEKFNLSINLGASSEFLSQVLGSKNHFELNNKLNSEQITHQSSFIFPACLVMDLQAVSDIEEQYSDCKKEKILFDFDNFQYLALLNSKEVDTSHFNNNEQFILCELIIDDIFEIVNANLFGDKFLPECYLFINDGKLKKFNQ